MEPKSPTTEDDGVAPGAATVLAGSGVGLMFAPVRRSKTARPSSLAPASDGEEGRTVAELAGERAGLLNRVGGLHSEGDRPGREPEIMAVCLRGRLVSRRFGAAARPADQGHHPGAPPEDLLEFQVGDLECTLQGVRQVSAAMSLDGIELRKQVGTGRNTHHHVPVRACQVAEPADRRPIVVEMLYHVEGKHGVVGPDLFSRQGLGEVHLHQLPARSIQSLKGSAECRRR